METGAVVSVTIYFIAMLAIGFYAWKKSTEDIKGYLLGGRDLGPAVAALSAGAADMSGWLLMGLPGETYRIGLSASWIAIGFVPCIGGEKVSVSSCFRTASITRRLLWPTATT